MTKGARHSEMSSQHLDTLLPSNFNQTVYNEWGKTNIQHIRGNILITKSTLMIYCKSNPWLIAPPRH